MKEHIYLLSAAMLMAGVNNAIAAEVIQINERNFANYLASTDNFGIKLNGDQSLYKIAKTVRLKSGVYKNKYIQFYQGIPVFSSMLTATQKNTQLSQWWGTYLKGVTQDLSSVTPKLSQTQVLDIVLKDYKLSLNQISHQNVTLYIKHNSKSLKAELVYWVDVLEESGAMPRRPNMLINANTGEIIDSWNGLTTQEAKGPGGNEKSGKYYYGVDYDSLIVNDNCEMKTENVSTYNMNGQKYGEKLFKFACPENTFKEINGAYSPLNDAHYFGNVVFDMYKEWFNTRPLKTRLKLRVHYGQNFENAFWDGQQMTFGDGGSRLYPLTGLDVVSHEVSHGVTQQNSNLIYKYQSGGINESFSDMAGEMAEFYMKSSRGEENDWLVGNEIIKGPYGLAMRYFKNPSDDGRSIGHAHDYNDNLDVHYSSGVYNKAFYTLAHRSNWGIRKAFEVFLLANQVYWKSDATFDSAACGVNKAAADLGYDVSDVVESFKIVGVEASCGVDPDPEPTPDDVVLENGRITYNVPFDSGVERRYVLNVPSLPWYPYVYKQLNVYLFGQGVDPSNIAELYIRYKKEGLSTGISFKSISGGEYITVNFPAAGNYHILLKGKSKGKLNLQAYYAN